MSDLRLIEMSFAFERASGAIESSCLFEQDWFDLESADEDLTDEIAYLESRQLLEHHPDHPSWVAIRNESESEEVQS